MGDGRRKYLKKVTLLHKEVQLVLQLVQQRPLQEILSLAERIQTMSLSEENKNVSIVSL